LIEIKRTLGEVETDNQATKSGVEGVAGGIKTVIGLSNSASLLGLRFDETLKYTSSLLFLLFDALLKSRF
jgi:hypothetical protein